MTPEDFHRLTAPPRTRLSPSSLRQAYAVLVDGRGISAVGAEFGVSRQHVDQCVKRVERELRAELGVPAGWECVTVCVPACIALEIRAIAAGERKKAGLVV